MTFCQVRLCKPSSRTVYSAWFPACSGTIGAPEVGSNVVCGLLGSGCDAAEAANKTVAKRPNPTKRTRTFIIRILCGAKKAVRGGSHDVAREGRPSYLPALKLLQG